MYKEILVNVEQKEKRVAILEDGRLEEFYIERRGTQSLPGNIYKGRVKSVVPGIGAAFLDLGLEKDGFLYVSDVVAPLEDCEEVHLERVKARPEITSLVKKGQELLVQVIKAPIGTKGVRLTTYITLPARYLVLLPTEPQRGVSRRIEEEAERKRLKKIMEELKLPKGMGLIVRTAGHGRKMREFVRELRYLLRLWRRIEHHGTKARGPSLIHKGLDLVLKVIRDSFTEDVNRLVVDERGEHKKILNWLRVLGPHLGSKVRLYERGIPLFEKYGLEKEIARTFQRKVSLKSGSYILIEPTEALVTIDVNTGRYVGKRTLEETVTRTNYEACREIARQIRLRDIGGIIVIDFIDMAKDENRKKVLRSLKGAFERDKAKTDILPFSDIGLVEVTRQRQGPGLASALYEICPHCKGKGSVKSVATISIETLRKLKAHLIKTKNKEMVVLAHPAVVGRLLNEDRDGITALERTHRAKILVKEDAGLLLDEIKLT